MSLCKCADSEESEGEKFRNIQKGIREDAFQLLFIKDPKVVANLIDIWKSLQDACSSRIRITQASATVE